MIRILTDCRRCHGRSEQHVRWASFLSSAVKGSQTEVENCNCRPPTQRLPIILCTCSCRSGSKTKSVAGESPDSSLNLVLVWTCFASSAEDLKSTSCSLCTRPRPHLVAPPTACDDYMRSMFAASANPGRPRLPCWENNPRNTHGKNP